MTTPTVYLNGQEDQQGQSNTHDNTNTDKQKMTMQNTAARGGEQRTAFDASIASTPTEGDGTATHETDTVSDTQHSHQPDGVINISSALSSTTSSMESSSTRSSTSPSLPTVIDPSSASSLLHPPLDDSQHHTVIYSSSDDSKYELRFLISSAQVGSIIGKGGANVRNVRDETNCYVSILKSEYRDVLERVLVIKGTQEQDAQAVEKIAELSDNHTDRHR